MAYPSYTYTLTNGTTADASQVMQNLNDILNGVTDGTKDLSIAALTVAGTATLNGNVAIGNASGDDLTITASLASSIPIKTNNSYDVGAATKGLRKLYLGNGGAGSTCSVVAASHATTREYTIPDCGADASFVMSQLAQTISGQKTFSNGYCGNAPLVYITGTQNPSGTGDVTDNFTSGATSLSNSDISVSGPSTGTWTFTFNRAGNYLITETYYHSHAAAYTIAWFPVTRGGTATRYGVLSDVSICAAGDDGGDTNAHASTVFVITATATQTYTWKPQLRSAGIGTASQHSFAAAIVITPL